MEDQLNENFLFVMRVRYGECDAQQVVFNSRYGEYADVAVTEYFRILFGGVKELLKQDLDTQVVHFSIDWKSPARFDDVLGVTVATSRVGKTSFSLQVDFCEFFSKRLIAASELTYVLVSAGRHEKVLVTDDFRKQLVRGAPKAIINQSGAPLL